MYTPPTISIKQTIKVPKPANNINDAIDQRQTPPTHHDTPTPRYEHGPTPR